MKENKYEVMISPAIKKDKATGREKNPCIYCDKK